MLRFWSAGSPSVLENFASLLSSHCHNTTPLQIMDALSREWRSGIHYATGSRVAFKITGVLGLAAFECLQSHISMSDNQPTAGGNEYWKYYPRGFPRN